MFIQIKDGLRLRDPANPQRILATDEPHQVDDHDLYWHRRLLDGDCTQITAVQADKLVQDKEAARVAAVMGKANAELQATAAEKSPPQAVGARPAPAAAKTAPEPVPPLA